MNEKLNEILKDQEFVEKLLALDTEKDVQALLAENGVELSIEEIDAIKKAIELQTSNTEELSEEDLENVAGGSIGDIIEGVSKAIVALGDGVDKWTRRRW